MYTERALSCYTSNRRMLTTWHVKAEGHGLCTRRYWDYTTDRPGVMAQKAEDMFPKTLKKWLYNVQLFQESESSKYREKRSDILIRIRFPVESSFWMSVSGYKLTIFSDIQPANWIVVISASSDVQSLKCLTPTPLLLSRIYSNPTPKHL